MRPQGWNYAEYEFVYNELAKPNVTLTFLWEELCERETDGEILYKLTQFNEKCDAYITSNKQHCGSTESPLNFIEVDWADNTLATTEASQGSLPTYSVCCIPFLICIALWW